MLRVTCVFVGLFVWPGLPPEPLDLGQIIWLTDVLDLDQELHLPLAQGCKVMHAMPAAGSLCASEQFLPGCLPAVA